MLMMLMVTTRPPSMSQGSRISWCHMYPSDYEVIYGYIQTLPFFFFLNYSVPTRVEKLCGKRHANRDLDFWSTRKAKRSDHQHLMEISVNKSP